MTEWLELMGLNTGWNLSVHGAKTRISKGVKTHEIHKAEEDVTV